MHVLKGLGFSKYWEKHEKEARNRVYSRGKQIPFLHTIPVQKMTGKVKGRIKACYIKVLKEREKILGFS